MYSIAYITTLGCEKVREIISSEPVALSYVKDPFPLIKKFDVIEKYIFRHKFAVWAWNMWNPCDAAAIIFFVIGLTLRFRPNTMDVGRVIYCLDSIYWYLRILNILGVNKYLGQYTQQKLISLPVGQLNFLIFVNRSACHNDG